MVNEAALVRRSLGEAGRLRFMARSAASCAEGTLHSAKRCFINNLTLTDEALSLRTNMKQLRLRFVMKHSALASYDEKMKNDSICVCNSIETMIDYCAKIAGVEKEEK